MQATKFNFSPEEIAAISEHNFFLLKNSATQKIIKLFGCLETEIKKEIEYSSISEIENHVSKGKIFRGENYKLFPYIILDCPRYFSKQSVFAFRSMFWWGHEFSFTLHLQGEAFDNYKKIIYDNFNLLAGKDVYFCVNDTPWHYDFEKSNFLPFENIKEGKDKLLLKPFIKLSRKLTVNSYQKVFEYGIDSFKLFMQILKNSK